MKEPIYTLRRFKQKHFEYLEKSQGDTTWYLRHNNISFASTHISKKTFEQKAKENKQLQINREGTMGTYRDDIDEMFYRINEDGNAVILYSTDGSAVRRLDENVYPIGSELSARYEHPEGIVLSVSDAKAIGIPEE